MADIFHTMGADLSLGPTGDLATVDGDLLTQQRVLRRLLTNPGDYIWNLGYGAGLPRFVGKTTNTMAINGVVRSQMLQEASVASTPAPTTAVSAPGQPGYVIANITYTSLITGTKQVMTVPVS